MKNADEARAYLRAFMEKINKQNNRYTASPYFYVIRTERWRPCKEGYGSGTTRTVWVDWRDDPTTYHSREEFLNQRVEEILCPAEPPKHPPYGADSDELAAYDEDMAAYNHERRQALEKAEKEWEKLEEFEEEQYFTEENVFFTEEGYEDHVRLNGHNLGKRGRDYHSYVKHAFRNPELNNLFQAIALLVDMPWERK